MYEHVCERVYVCLRMSAVIFRCTMSSDGSMGFSVFMDKHFCLSEEPECVCACMCIAVRDSARGSAPAKGLALGGRGGAWVHTGKAVSQKLMEAGPQVRESPFI